MPPHLQLERAAQVVSRRLFIKALAMGMSIPAAMRFSRMATAATTPAPKRFMVFFTPHGTAPEHYAPRIMNNDPTNFALDKTNVSILGPLEPYKQYVNVYDGLQYVGKGDTHEGVVNCLSGYMQADLTGARTSVEHVIGKALGVKPLILGACSHRPSGLDKDGMLFWNGTAIDPQKSPVAAADMLFAGGTATTPPATANADVELQKDLLAFTATEIQDLQKTVSSLTREKNKLQTHLTSVQSLQADSNMMARPSSCSSAPALPTVEMVRKASAGNKPDPSGANDYFYQEANFPLLLQAQLEVCAQALICNAAPIIGLMPMYTVCNFDFGFAGAKGSHHDLLSHTMYQAAPGAQYNSPISVDNLQATIRAPFATAQKWFTTQLVNKLVSLLATTADPAANDGSKVLDNTLILWISEIGDGQDHNRASEIIYPQAPASLPIVTIGKCAGAIKSGQVVRFPVDVDKQKAIMTDRPAVDLYATLAQAMGVKGASFPGQTGVIAGVLT